MASNTASQPSLENVPIVRRALPRSRLTMPVTIGTELGNLGCRLRDLSTAGAMIESPSVVPVGTEVILRCRGLDVFGVVVWQHVHCSGIEFHSPIADGDVAHQLSRAREAIKKRHSPSWNLMPAPRHWALRKNN